ncbi:hypothetical protein DUI87_06408 [Hirundo rustica rustica]|uniref:Uncharacterized protein n=1 Tax=Hirundo rustica rustica TaxID=333673 RepID=A0A3M0KTG9_HIRRU|nr:hypothetical protein DUI87_06408 [Hirundo rustica rustica]
MIRGPGHLSCKEKLRELSLKDLGERKLWGYLTQGAAGELERDFLPGHEMIEQEERWLKIEESRLGSDIRNKIFTVKVMRHCNRLPKEDVDASSLEMFKARLNEAWYLGLAEGGFVHSKGDGTKW